MATTSSPLAGAVIPEPPKQYDQAFMIRLVDVMNKIIEQLVRPQQVTGARSCSPIFRRKRHAPLLKAKCSPECAPLAVPPQARLCW